MKDIDYHIFTENYLKQKYPNIKEITVRYKPYIGDNYVLKKEIVIAIKLNDRETRIIRIGNFNNKKELKNILDKIE